MIERRSPWRLACAGALIGLGAASAGCAPDRSATNASLAAYAPPDPTEQPREPEVTAAELAAWAQPASAPVPAERAPRCTRLPALALDGSDERIRWTSAACSARGTPRGRD